MYLERMLFKEYFKLLNWLYNITWFGGSLRLIKGDALLTVGYAIFGNKSYSYKMYS